MKRLPDWIVNSKSGRVSMRGSQLGQAGASTGREQTALIKLFKAEAMSTKRQTTRAMSTKRQTTADSVLGPYHRIETPQTAAMPLAQAAPQIGCERPPSMACAGRGPSQFGRAHGTRRPGQIADRGRVHRACDTVVRFVNGDRRLIEGTHPACH